MSLYILKTRVIKNADIHSVKNATTPAPPSAIVNNTFTGENNTFTGENNTPVISDVFFDNRFTVEGADDKLKPVYHVEDVEDRPVFVFLDSPTVPLVLNNGVPTMAKPKIIRVSPSRPHKVEELNEKELRRYMSRHRDRRSESSSDEELEIVEIHELQEVEAHELQDVGAHELQEVEAHELQDMGAHKLQEVEDHELQDVGAHELQDVGVHELQNVGVHELQNVGVHELQDVGAHELQEMGVQRFQQEKANLHGVVKKDLGQESG